MTTKTKPAKSTKATVCWEAKACPFCGWVPNIQPWHGGAPTKMLIACDDSRCAVQPSVSGETKRTALARWNKRSPVAA